MKRTKETKRAEHLPSFLDESAAAATPATAATEDASAVDEPSLESPAEAAAEATPNDPADPAGAELAEALAPAEADDAPTTRHAAAPTTTSRSMLHRQRRHSGGKSGGGLFLLTGIATAVGALLLPLLPSDVVGTLTNQGFGPQGLFVCGLVLAAAGASMRRTARLQQNLDAAEERRRADTEALHEGLHGLISAQASTAERPTAEGGDLQHVLLALQRQDEKLNNLTKAFKMYGKPLMEIANQGTELAGGIATVKTLVEAGSETARQSLLRMEAQLRSPAGKQELADLQANLLKVAQKIESLAGQSPAAALQPVQQQLGRLEVTTAAMAQRLEDSEVRKSLLRLEEAAHKDRDTLQQLLRGDSVQKATAELQDRLDRATRGLNDGLVQLRDGNLGGLETAVRDIQREVASVATTVAQINAAVKNGARATAAAPAPAAAQAAAPAAAATVPTAPAEASPPPASAAPTANAGGKPAGEASGYQTGSRSSGGKNVLGAIAKLKQMKS